jgi:PncC family amidohydrolase
MTVAVAESCTGGLLAGALTSLSGSSAYFISGAVVYSNSAKQQALNVPALMLKKYGAVSDPVGRALAENIRKKARTDFGIGITGIAGPTGGSAAKPVGTVFIAVSTRAKTVCRRFLFKGTRSSIRKQSVKEALVLLNKNIK